MLADPYFRHWDKIFWIIFTVIAVSVFLSLAFSVINFEFSVLLGVFMVIIGSGKLAQEINSRKIMNYQDDAYGKIHQISQHLERTFNIATEHKEKTDYRLHKLDKRRKEMESRAEKDYRELAKKIIDLENKTTRISKAFIKNQKRKIAPLEASFTEKVLSVIRKIPRGKVTTYAEIANVLEKPKSSRAVGNVIVNNLHMKSVPLHRVVYSDGSVPRKGKGSIKKRRKLKREGIKIEKDTIKNFDQRMFEFLPKI